MTNLDKLCHKLMDSNHELKAKCALLEKENEQLTRKKERYKKLYAFAHEQMDNRILTIKNFVEDCSDDEVKHELKKLLWTEVLDYDVSAKNRALIEENEQLKKENEELKRGV